ncbi:hypothetical protein WR164_14430 [Philodulcilactobacillus myokoensis]|uniref:DUF5776 domain-containing protein n=1 Tax=Philodulcilactobacillus myokoensis TaxID=2929573 RepID=A0A9W6B1Z4_9LACO|nr:DUF5776 domain-containing protein [Philodulcilactobacillus myokoensis]GLB47464.1 hypothetical protein WR164_14430 [Philodulcilactobacillus myokoensis]
MQYNKNQFNKINDKKVMKKVKKQWVVVSLATLALIGGYSAMNLTSVTPTHVVIAHAAQTLNSGGSAGKDGSADSATPSSGSSSQPQSAPAAQQATGQSSKPAQNSTSSNSGSTTNSSNTESDKQNAAATNSDKSSQQVKSSNNDDSNKTAQKAVQASGVASNYTSKSGVASTGSTGTNQSSGSASNPSNSSGSISGKASSASSDSNGNDTKMVSVSTNKGLKLNAKSLNELKSIKLTTANNPSLTSDQKQQADDGADAYWNSIHPNDSDSDVSISGASTSDQNYLDGYSGASAAWNQYNSNNSSYGTQPVKNYTQNSASNPNDPSSVDPNQLDTGKASVSNGEPVDIPFDPTTTGNQTSQESSNDDRVDHSQAYNEGVARFLARQGTQDAETGRWNGADKNGSYSAYTPDSSSTNAYDQAYSGAQAAINQQFNSDNTFSNYKNGIFNPSEITTPSANYDFGFQDVKTKVNNGTAFVSNAQQITNALSGVSKSVDNPTLTGSITSDGSINHIRLLTDINYSGVSSIGESQFHIYYNNGSSAFMNLDGQNHSTDFHGISYYVNQPSNGNITFGMSNFNAAYGYNFYGPFKIESGTATVNYSNVTYVGSQLMSSAYVKANVNVYGNLNAFSVGNYTSPFQTFVPTESYNSTDYTNGKLGNNNHYGSNQQNFEANNLELHPGSNYYGSTTGGNTVELTGNLTLDSGSNMTVAPLNGSSSEHTSQATGLYLSGSSSKVNIESGSHLTINPQAGYNRNAAQPFDITQSSGSIVVDGGTLTVNINGQPKTYSDDEGTIKVDNNGHFDINAKKLGNYSNAILNVGGTLNITNRGNFSIVTDGSGSNNLTLLNNSSKAGSFNIDNPGNNVTLQIQNNGNGKLFANQINAYSVRYGVSNDGRSNVTFSDPSYEVDVPKSGNIKYYNTSNHSYSYDTNTDTSQLKYLTFKATPNAYLDGPISVQTGSSNTYSVNGNLRLDNLPSNDPTMKGTGNQKVYIDVNVDGSQLTNPSNVKLTVYDPTGKDVIATDNNGQPINLTNTPNDSDSKSFNTSHNYTGSINIPNINNNDIIHFSYQLNSKPQNNVSVTSHYFVMDQKQTLSEPSGGGTQLDNDLENPLKGEDPISSTTDANGKFIQPYTPSADDASASGYQDGLQQAQSTSLSNIDKARPTDNGSNWSNYSNSSEDIKNAYKNSYNSGFYGYQQGIKDRNSNSYNYSNPTNPNKDSSSSYTNGYHQVQNDYNDGFNNRITSSNPTDPDNNSGYTLGYNNASGVKDTISNQYNPNSSDNNYINGHNSFNSGLQDPNAKNDNNSNQYNTDNAYRYGSIMSNGFNNAKNPNDNSSSKSNVIGNPPSSIDNQAYQDGEDSYNGMSDALSKDSSQNGSTAYNASNSIAKSGLNDGINPNSKQTDTSNYNSQQKTIYNNSKAAGKGINDALSSTSNTPSDGGYNNADEVDQKSNYQNAYNAVKDGMNSKVGQQPSSSNDKSQNVAYNVGQATEAGINAAQSQSTTSNPYSNDPEKTAYENAKQDYNKGKNSKLTSFDNNKDDAYNAGIAAGKGLTDVEGSKTSEDHPDYNSWSNAEKNAYTNAQNAYQAGMKNGDAGRPDKSADPDAYKAGQDVSVAANEGVSDAINGKTSKDNSDYSKWKSSGDTSKTTAYDNAQKAYQAGLNGDNGSDKANAKLNSTANSAGLAAKAGIDDAQKGKDNSSQNYPNDPENTAYKNAQKAFNAGLDNNKTADDQAAAKLNPAANAAGQASQQGLSDAVGNQDIRKDPKSDYNNGTWSPSQKTAYDNAQKAYQAGNDGNKTADDQAAAKLNPAANAAGAASQQGLSDAVGNQDIRKDPKSDYNNGTWSPSQKTAYDNAQKAYQAGNDGNKTADDQAAAKLNPAANAAGQASQQGLSDAVGNQDIRKDPKSDYNNGTWSPSQKTAYDNAQKAYQAGNDGNKTADDQAVAKLNPAANAAGQASQQGLSDAVGNQDIRKDPKSDYNNGTWSPSQKTAYDNAQKAYQAGNDGNKTADDQAAAKLNPAANAAGQASQQGLSDAVGNQDIRKDPKSDYNNGTWSPSQKTAYDNAQKAYQAGNDGNKTADDQAAAKLNPAANAAGQASQQGLSDAVGNQDIRKDPKSDYNNGTWSPSQKTAYDNAQKAYQAGNDGNKTADDQAAAKLNPAANAAGAASQQGLSDAVGNQDIRKDPKSDYNNGTWNPSQKTAYDNAQKAYQAGNDGNKTADDQAAAKLNPAANAAGAASQQGLSDAVGNQDIRKDPKSDYNNGTWSPSQKTAYDNAQKAYQAGNDGNKTADDQAAAKLNPAANAAGQASQQGLSDAVGNQDIRKDPKSDYNNGTWNPSQKTAYDNAQKAYQAGNDGNKTADDQAAAKLNPAANAAGAASQQGLSDAVGNQDIRKDPKSDYNNGTWSPSQKTAYDNAQKAYQAGNDGNKTADDQAAAKLNPAANAAGQASQQGLSDAVGNQDIRKDPKSDYNNGTWSPLQKTAYDNAQKAYQAGNDGNKTADDQAAAKLNPVANAAGQASQQGLSDAVGNQDIRKDPKSDYNNGTWNPSQKTAYDNAQKAYQAGNDGNKTADDQAAAKLNPAANAAGQASQQGLSDAVGNQDIRKDPKSDYNNGTWSPSQKTAYDNAQKAYQAGNDGNKTADDQAAAKLNPAANAAGQASQQGLSDAVGNQDIRKDPKSDYNNGTWSPSQKTAYDNAQKAYQAGNDGNKTADDQAAAKLNPAANAAGAASQQGLSDAVGNQDIRKDPKSDYNNGTWSPSQKTAYDNAQKAYQAGNDGNKTADDQAAAKLNPAANAAGQASQQGLSDAVGNQDIRKDPKSDYNNGTWSPSQKTAYDNAQKAYQAGNDGNKTADDQATAKLNPAANAAGQASQQGLSDAVGNQDIRKDPKSDYNNGTWSPSQKTAYDNAQKAYQAGNDGNKTADDQAAAKLNPAANAAGQASQQGLSDAVGNQDIRKDPKSDYNNGTWSPLQKTAYDNAQKAYQAGNDGNKTADDQAAAKLNPAANAAGAASQQGLSDAVGNQDIRKDPKSDYNNGTWNPSQKTAYDNAQKAYQAGNDGNKTADDQAAAKLNPAANAAGAASQQGLSDAVGNQDIRKDPKSDYNNGTWSPSQKTAYDNAQKAYQAGENGNTTTGDAKLDNAANVAGQAAQTGINDAQAGHDNSDNYNNPIEKSAYQNAQTSYSAGLKGDTTSSNAKLNPIANGVGTAAGQGITDSISNINAANDSNSDYRKTWNQNQKDAYDRAQKAYKAGLNGYNNSDSSLNNTASSTGQDASSGINDGVSGKQSQSHKDGTYSDGYNVGEAARKGANDAAAGSNPDPQFNGSNSVDNAYNNAYKNVKNNQQLNGSQPSLSNVAAQAAQIAQQGKNDAAKGFNLADPKNKSNSNPYYNGTWTPSQKQNYDNAQAAYQAGNQGDTTSNNAKRNKDANDAGYKNYESNQTAPTNYDYPQGQASGAQAFVNGTAKPINQANLVGKSDDYKNGFLQSYHDAQSGFNTGLDGEPNDEQDNQSFSAGYQAGQDYRQGSLDATQGRKPEANGSYSYHIGYDAYNNGANDKKVSNDFLNNLTPDYRKAYEQNYNRGLTQYHQDVNDGAKVGRRSANDLLEPTDLAGQSSAYIKAYRKAYDQTLKEVIPRYVYNLGTIFEHKSYRFSRKNRIEKYHRATRPNRHVFRVTGFRRTASGKLVYKVQGHGWITANKLLVADAYYRHSHDGADSRRIKVIKHGGTYVYNDKQFNDQTQVRFLPTGTKMHVKYVVRLGHLTRFYIGNGEYISSNKTIVKEIR